MNIFPCPSSNSKKLFLNLGFLVYDKFSLCHQMRKESQEGFSAPSAVGERYPLVSSKKLSVKEHTPKKARKRAGKRV